MLLSIIFAILFMALTFGVLKVMQRPGSSRTWAITILPGLALGAMNYFGTTIRVILPWFFLVAIIILMVAVVVWAARAAAEIWEFAFFIAMEVVAFFVLRNISIAIANTMITTFWPSFMHWLPFVALIATIGIIIVAGLTLVNKLAAVLAGVAAFGLIIILFFTTVNLAAPKEEETESKNVSWYAFYNLSMQNDKDESNDFNFGYNPYEKKKTVQDYDSDLRERIAVDPALGAATMAWVDANLGTDYLGEEYEANDRDWSKAINAAKRNFMADQKGYYAKITAFFKLLDSAEIGLTNSDQELNDQMYMNPYTEDKVPEVVVYETTDHVGWQLVYTFNIKDNKIKVAFRIECGYQPTNVAEIMNITPQKGGGGGDTPTPSPTPDPDPPYNKDKTQGTQGDLVAPNDNTGPGEDTNNGVGATSSTKEQSDNSNHMTYKEYVEKIEELEEINETQKVGDEDSTESIDQPTPIAPPAHTTDGKEITTEPAGAWGGPAD